MMKKMFFGMLLMAMSVMANATIINGVEYGSGLTLQTGTVFFNVIDDDPNDGNPGDHVQGIGTVNLIQDENGIVVWDYFNDNNGVEYNFVFDSLIIDYSVTDEWGTTTYRDIAGDFIFYSNTIGTFNTTGDYNVDSIDIMLGDLNLDFNGHAVDTWSVVGTQTDNIEKIGNAGTGQLDLIGGDAYDVVVQDTLALTSFKTKIATYADSTFNFSTDNLATQGYMFSGSVDMAMHIVNEPDLLALMGLGLIGLGFVTRKKVK